MLLEIRDVLFNEGGDLDKLGRGWVWEGQVARCTFQNHVFRARLRDPANQPKFVSWWGNSRGLEYFLRSGKQTTNLASINKTVLSALPIALPSPAEQAEIVRRVGTLLAIADGIEKRYVKAQRQVQRIAPITLATAFAANSSPRPERRAASALLARIAAQRNVPIGTASAPTPRRGRPPPRP